MNSFTKNIVAIAFLSTAIMGCKLTEVENPNITEDTYLSKPNVTSTWLTGLRKQMALTMNQVVVNTELVSDNYFNNRTLSSKVFDIPQIDNFDLDVNNTQAAVGRLRELAQFGIDKVAPADPTTKPTDIAEMLYVKAYAHLLSAELFVALPGSSKGPVLTPKEHYNIALTSLDQATALQTDAKEKLVYSLLKARVYYGLGDSDKAVAAANVALGDKLLLKQVLFDGQNAAPNDFQTYIFSSTNNEFAPLPRLDFLDPKYFHLTTIAQDQKPISIIKSEEAYLIIAEALVSKNDLEGSKTMLKNLLTDVIAKRPVVQLNDNKETRNGGNRKDYPLTAVKVKFDASGEEKSGYVYNRQTGTIAIGTVSGTKVTTQEITDAPDQDALLYLIYRIRQEVFFAEGRRMTDLGIKFPVSQTEQLNNPNVKPEHGKAQIPSFIPLNRGMDDFTNNTGTGVVTMKYDMNKVLVTNKNAKEIFPFIN